MKPTISIIENVLMNGTETYFTIDGELLMRTYDTHYAQSNGEGALQILECLEQRGLINLITDGTPV